MLGGGRLSAARRRANALRIGGCEQAASNRSCSNNSKGRSAEGSPLLVSL